MAFVRPGPWCTRRDAEPPAHPRVAVGHAHRPGLVAGGEEAATGGDDRVRHGQVPAPHQAEHDVSSQGMDGAADGLGDEHRANASVWARCGQRRRCWCSAPSRRWSRSRSTSSGSRPRRCSPRCWSGSPPRCGGRPARSTFPRWTFVAAQAVLGVTLGAYLEPDALEAVGGAWLPVALVSAGTLCREHGRRAHPRSQDRAQPRDGDARDDRRRRLRHRRDGRRARRRRPARGLHAVHARARRRAAHAAARARAGAAAEAAKRRAKPCWPPGTTGCSRR